MISCKNGQMQLLFWKNNHNLHIYVHGIINRWGLGPAIFMKKNRIKIWAERHALAIAFRFSLTVIWPMAFIGLAMAALAVLILVIALVQDVPVA